jgi:hypothetical protein
LRNTVLSLGVSFISDFPFSFEEFMLRYLDNVGFFALIVKDKEPNR